MEINFKSWKTWTVLGIISLLVVGFFVFLNTPKTSEGSGISSYFYDANKNPVGQYNSLILTPEGKEIQGVSYMVLRPFVKSTSDRAIDVKIVSVSPSNWTSYFPINPINVQPGATAQWYSSMIDITPYEGTEVPVQVCFEASWTYAGKLNTQQKCTPVNTFTVSADPVYGFDVGIGVGNDTNDTTTTTNTTNYCGNGLCDNGETHDTCPADCIDTTSEVIFRTNAIGGDYNNDGTWIAVNINGTMRGYGYKGTSGSLTFTNVGYTPENYPIEYSSGYPPTERLYISDGTHINVYDVGDADAASAVLDTYPTEPYTSNGQEVTN